MSGIQAPEEITHSPSRLRKNALKIAQTFGAVLSEYSESPHSGFKRNEQRVFPIIESNRIGQKGRTYCHGIPIPLTHKIYKSLEIGLSQADYEANVGRVSLLLRLVPWKNEEDFSSMPRLCSRDAYQYDDKTTVYVPLTYDEIWADFSPLCIDRKGTYDLVKRYLDNPDTHSLGYELKGALLKLGLVNLLYLR